MKTDKKGNTIITTEEVERLVERNKDENTRMHHYVIDHEEMLKDGIERGTICQKKVDYYKYKKYEDE